MSLADLPDVLIVHLTSYLEYEDICNLMETSKKNYNAIKAYKKDKIKLKSLDILNCFNNPVLEATINYELDQMDHKLSYKRFDKNKNVEENSKDVLSECSTVENIDFHNWKITSELFTTLFETKVKIKNVYITACQFECTGEEFATFCKKFKGSTFQDCFLELINWTDNILLEVIDASTHIMNEQHYYNPDVEDSVTLVTDRTLTALFGGIPYPCRFDLFRVHNLFTIEGIVKSLKNIKDSKSNMVDCDLGILQFDQLHDADRYFNINNGELKDEYDIFHWDERCRFYEIHVGLGHSLTYNNEKEKTSHIIFSVVKY